METLDRIRFVTRHFNDLQGLRYAVPLGLITLSGGGTTWFANRPVMLLRGLLVLGAFVLMLGARRYYRRTFGEVERQPVRPAPELASLSIYSPAGPPPRLEGVELLTPALRRCLLTMGPALTLFLILQTAAPRITIEVDESLVQPPWRTLNSMFLADLGESSLSTSPSTAKAAGGQLMYALYGSIFLGLWLWRGRSLSQSYHLVLGALLSGLSILGSCLGFFYTQEGEIARILGLFLPAVVHLWVALLLCGFSMVLAGLLDHWQLARAMGRPMAPRAEV